MAWFKVDDKLHSHPKARRAGPAAMGLWVLAGSWSSDQLTDGFIPADMLPAFGGRMSSVSRLIDAGLWDVVDGGWEFHDWLSCNPLRADIQQTRGQWRDRQRKARSQRQVERGSGENVTRDSRETENDVTRDSRTPVTHPSTSPVPSRPVPYQKKDPPPPAGEGGAGGECSAHPAADSTAAAAAAPKPKPAPRGTRLPDNWTPTRNDANQKTETNHKPDQLREQLDQFRDYWTAKTGTNATKLDWDATWRNWIRRTQPATNNNHNQRRRSGGLTDDQWQAAYDRAIAADKADTANLTIIQGELA